MALLALHLVLGSCQEPEPLKLEPLAGSYQEAQRELVRCGLRELPAPGTDDPLRQIDSRLSIRREQCESLTDVPLPRQWDDEPLASFLFSHPHDAVRAWAIIWIRCRTTPPRYPMGFSTEHCSELQLAILEDRLAREPNPELVLSLLVRIGNHAAHPTVTRMLTRAHQHPAERVRAWALHQHHEHSKPYVQRRQILLDALDDPSSLVKTIACYLLAQSLTLDEVGTWLDRTAPFRRPDAPPLLAEGCARGLATLWRHLGTANWGSPNRYQWEFSCAPEPRCAESGRRLIRVLIEQAEAMLARPEPEPEGQLKGPMDMLYSLGVVPLVPIRTPGQPWVPNWYDRPGVTRVLERIVASPSVDGRLRNAARRALERLRAQPDRISKSRPRRT